MMFPLLLCVFLLLSAPIFAQSSACHGNDPSRGCAGVFIGMEKDGTVFNHPANAGGAPVELSGVSPRPPQRAKNKPSLCCTNSTTTRTLVTSATYAAGGNQDGVIDQQDAVFSQLRLWNDANHNGISEPAELTELAANGIVSFNLDYREDRRRDRYGNVFRYRGKVNATSNAPPRDRTLELRRLLASGPVNH